MTSSQGLKKSSDFDVLNSQAKENQYVHQIPIRKVGFSGVKQPTDLPLIEVENEKDDDAEHIQVDEKFSVSRELLEYLDNLIYKKNLPLRTLKFDIEFSKSNEDVAGYLESYVEKSNLIPEKDLDKLFSFIGYEKTGGENLHNHVVEHTEGTKISEITDEVVSKPHHSRIEEFFNPEKVALDNLNFARSEYIKLLHPYLKKLKKDKEVYAKIMAELGGASDMPTKDEPKELKSAREEYFETKASIVVGLEDDIAELELFKKEFLEHFEEKTKNLIEKSLNVFDKYENNTLLAEDLLSGDVSNIEKIVPPTTFDGMRTEKSVENKISDQKRVEKPKNAPVDIGVAIEEALAQNVISLDWEGKRIEIRQAGEEINVFLEGKNIAGGFMSPTGPKVRINREFKSGFLFADTIQEKALKFAGKTLKTLK